MSLQTKIANSFQNLKSKNKENMTKGSAESLLAGLERHYTTFQVNHEKIMHLKELDKKHTYFTSKLCDLVEDSVYDRRGDFLDFLETFKANGAAQDASTSVTTHSITAQPTNVSFQSLPIIDLPKFSGKFSDWENFRDVFRCIIHRREDLSPIMKLHYLGTHLTGEALEKIKSLSITNYNYDRAWASLVDYYENQRRIVGSHIAEIVSVKSMKSDTSSEIKRIAREICNPIASLNSLNRAASLDSDLILHFTLNGLDLNTRKEWGRHLGDSVVPPTMKLQAFLQCQTLTLEAIEAGTRSSSNNNSKSQSSNSKPRKSEHDIAQSVYSHQTSASNPSKKKCSICNQSHFRNRCERFLNKTILGRKELIKSSNLCFNCLGKPNVKNCTSTYRCFLCKAKPQTLLHADSNQVISSSQTDQIDSVSSTFSPNCGNLVISEDDQSASLSATARVNALGPNGTKIQVRALIDPESQISFVTQALCNLLSLNCSSFSTVSSKVACLSIQLHFNSTFSLEVDGIVLPKVFSYKPPVVGGISDFEYLRVHPQ